MHGSIISKLWGRKRAKVIEIDIFKNDLLNIRTITYDFFVVVCLFVRPKASGCAYVLDSGINAVHV